jgi:DNA-binding NtrC family response regulator
VTSTSLPLREEAERGNFNRDLFFRLGVVNLDMPPLRERREDIPLLVNFLLEKVNRELQTQVDKFTFEATLVLSSYDWPGNVGELQDLIRELAADKRLGVLNVTDLPVSLQREMTFTDNSVSAADVPLRDAKRRFEREYFKDLLRRTKGNMSKASRNSRVGRPYLYKKINDYDINPNDYR